MSLIEERHNGHADPTEVGTDTLIETDADEAAAPAPPSPKPVPFPPLPFRGLSMSGLYESPKFVPGGTSGQLRLDVDGRYPQMVASGRLSVGLFSRVHWIAKLTGSGNTWSGSIFYKEGSVALLPQTEVKVSVTSIGGRKATVVFSGPRVASRVMVLPFKSTAFHDVEVEFDCAQGTTAVTTVVTNAHPNRPADLPAETLSIEDVFRRAGFKVTKTGGDSIVPISGAKSDGRWSDLEMHDAMQAHWSRFANKAQWSLWTFFASLHEIGTTLGGIMFDDIGPNHRQGTAIFEDAFIADPPAGDPSPAAWVQRMRFWTAVHEMGHAFNLAHSWQKSLVHQGNGPWLPTLADEPEARSFMNYPFNVNGGQTSFFGDFEYRFSDGELLFLRHAPSRFVQMGNAAWFDNHGFEQARLSPEPALRLELRVNRPKPTFSYLEPVNMELKLTNISAEPVLVKDNVLSDADGMTVVVKRQGSPAGERLPYAHFCLKTTKVALAPGESRYGSLLVSVGKGGWQISDPGRYLVQVAIDLGAEDVVSNALDIKVTPPSGREEEVIAQDYFTDDVGRAITFGGTKVLTAANDVLRDVTERLTDHPAAHHAHLALGRPYAAEYKRLVIDSDGYGPASAGTPPTHIRVEPADLDRAATELGTALLDQPQAAAETMGHIRYKNEVDRYADVLAEEGETGRAVEALGTLRETLQVRGVLPSVVASVAEHQAGLEATGTT